MNERTLNALRYLQSEPVPDSVWLGIQKEIARKKQPEISMAWRIAAALLVMALLGEIVSSYYLSRPTHQPNEYQNVFEQNNQWYHD
ncbi:MAG: hypothetical protein FGM54_01410 [Chitinophagaceae bacterium]|nr:hypothetical protein [Chitinophagaceae bacterium]